MKTIPILISLICAVNFLNAQTKNDKQIIREIMSAQEKAWNSGSIDDFMIPYWHHDSLKFIGKNGIQLGWKNTLDNYKRSYPNKGLMGTLTFDIISIEALDSNNAFVIGKWLLKREKGDINGYFTLLWKKMEDKWVIVTDHSS
jgi:hypothetical protein